MPPRDEQQAILNAQDRIRLVQAAPGSGKTWLVAEAIRREVSGWTDKHRGIAALSFTNVAGEEIRKSLGRDLSHPHFVGTLDSFLFRYVVRPFAKLRNPSMPQPTIVPGEQAGKLTANQPWFRTLLEINLGTIRQPKMKNVFEINIIGGTRTSPQLVTQLGWNRHELTPEQTAVAMRKKREIWNSSGRISHSDAAYMSFQILSDTNFGQEIVNIISHRFPIIFLDEVQDTGWFLGRSILEVMKNNACNALAVGDPDQSIYEFNGASPRIFTDIASLEGAAEYEMPTTCRCPNIICSVARKLSASDRDLIAVQPHTGRAIIAIHDGDEHLPKELLATISLAIASKNHKLIARGTATVNKLNGGPRQDRPQFSSIPLSNLHDAVNALRRGRMRSAYSLAEATVGRILLGTESPKSSDFEAIEIAPFDWRKIVVKILLDAEREIEGETLYQWGDRAIQSISSTLTEIGWWDKAPSPRLPNRPSRPNTISEPRSNWLANPEGGANIQPHKATTVHAVKGETHDTTIFYVPEARNNRECPSVSWWSGDAQNAEEKRIAYVAATRPRDTFILCLHRNTVNGFQSNRPEFLIGFEQIELSDLIAEYRAQIEDVGEA